MVHFVVGKNRKKRRVRIVILDTGMNVTHSTIQSAQFRKQIGGFFRNLEDFELNSHLFNPLHDEDDHGTHEINLLIKTTSYVTIYVVRVADQDRNLHYDHLLRLLYSYFRH